MTEENAELTIEEQIERAREDHVIDSNRSPRYCLTCDTYWPCASWKVFDIIETTSSISSQERERILLEEIDTLKKKIEALTEPKPSRSIKSYRSGDFVSVLLPNQVEPEDGRVIEHVTGKAAVLVATAKGEFPIASPDRIKKQGESWS